MHYCNTFAFSPDSLSLHSTRVTLLLLLHSAISSSALSSMVGLEGFSHWLTCSRSPVYCGPCNGKLLRQTITMKLEERCLWLLPFPLALLLDASPWATATNCPHRVEAFTQKNGYQHARERYPSTDCENGSSGGGGSGPKNRGFSVSPIEYLSSLC